MGLFDFFKRKKREEEVEVTYNGLTFMAPKPISNEEYQAKRRAEMDHWERKYDLSTVAGINAIPVPKFKARPSGGIGGATEKIEYYLMMKAGQYENAGEAELALACYRKANAIMPMSSTAYEYDRYMRLPRYLRKLRRFDEARAEEAKISAMFPDSGIFQQDKDAFIADMRLFGHSAREAERLYKEHCAECEEERQKLRRHEEYDWLWEHLPEHCPKSFSAYSRMKNQKTDKYNALVAEAKKLGYKIK